MMFHTVNIVIGGGLTVFLSIAVCSTLCRNMAHTYSKFPSLQAPPLAVPVVELPPGSSILGAMVAAGGWLLVGPLAVALVRGVTRDNPSTTIWIARVTAVEVTSAVARRRKGRTLSSARASSILQRFRRHLAGRYTVVDISPALCGEAMRLANAYALRAYDAVQLAASLEIRAQRKRLGFPPVTLISADQALNDAAEAEGLTVEDPRSHS